MPESKAPKETNEALRSRIKGFYQAFVDRKFRKADEFVAEETKDAFYASEKDPLKGFEIVDIFYAPDFQQAKVVTKISAEAGGVQYGRFTVQPVVQSLWKVEDGKWCYYVPAVRTVDSPFGKMVISPQTPDQPAVSPTAVLKAKRMTRRSSSRSTLTKTLSR